MKAISSNILHSSFSMGAETLKEVTRLKHLKAKKFLSTLKLFNKTTGELNNIEYDRAWTDNQNYLYKTFVMDDVRYQADKMGLTPIFVTTTLNTQYHPYNYNEENNTKHINKKYQGYSVKDGAERLQVIHRHLVNNFKVDRKRVVTKYVKVIEPHKSMVAHSHSIIWVESEHVESFINHHKNTIVTMGLNYKGQDLKVLSSKETKGTTVYLLKYVMKTLKGEDDVTMGWLTSNGIKRVMTNTRPSLSRDVFKRVSGSIPFNPNDKRPYLMQIKENLIIDKTITDIKGRVISNDVFVGDKPLYHVEKVVERKLKMVDYIGDDENEKDIIIYEATYSTKKLIIKELNSDKIIYDKANVVLFEDVESEMSLHEITESKNKHITLIQGDKVEEIYYF
jgi:hypothetical protein